MYIGVQKAGKLTRLWLLMWELGGKTPKQLSVTSSRHRAAVKILFHNPPFKQDKTSLAFIVLTVLIAACSADPSVVYFLPSFSLAWCQRVRMYLELDFSLGNWRAIKETGSMAGPECTVYMCTCLTDCVDACLCAGERVPRAWRKRLHRNPRGV